MHDKYNIISVLLSGIIHVLILGGLVVAIDFSKPAYPAIPLVITATLIAEEDLPAPPPVDTPEPVAATPQQDRLRAEEIKRQADMRQEQERIRLQEVADRKRREAADAERKRLREEEVERRRQEAERKRLEDLERQRQENLRQRREVEDAEVERRRLSEIEAEDKRLAMLSANDTTRWVFALQQQIARNFVLPVSAPENLECVVDIRQLPGGQVANVNVVVSRCNGNAAVRRAIEVAVHKASPLPSPGNPSIFVRDLQITFKPEQ